MKVILKENIENLGFANEVVNVKNGYGRNFLIPKGVATLATESALKVLAENIKQRAVKDKKIMIVGAMHNLSTGKVTFFDDKGNPL